MLRNGTQPKICPIAQAPVPCGLKAGPVAWAVAAEPRSARRQRLGGKRADLISLEGNPVADVANVQQRAGVMLQGRWVTEAQLQPNARLAGRILQAEFGRASLASQPDRHSSLHDDAEGS